MQGTLPPLEVFAMLRTWEKLVFDNIQSFEDFFFTDRFNRQLTHPPLDPMVSLSFSSETVKFTWVASSGQHIADSLSIQDFLEWARTI